MHEVRPENRFFDVSPRVVPANRGTAVEIRPLFDHCRLDDAVEYEVRYVPAEGFAQHGDWPEHEVRLLRPTGGVLRLETYFEGEQEHVIVVTDVGGGKRRRLGEFRVYSVEADLLARRPYKGDFHMHSYHSDGRESPAYVAGACRRIGLDFMALTDHHRYGPSLEAQRAYEEAPIDLRIYPGEEVHPPDSPVHIVNFGGRSSVNDLFADEEAYRRSVAALDARLGDLPEGVDRYHYASAAWCFEKIREAGGLGVFCHPYWFTDCRYPPGGPLTSCLLERKPFDAYEVLGGFTYGEFDSNTLQIARYYEAHRGAADPDRERVRCPRLREPGAGPLRMVSDDRPGTEPGPRGPRAEHQGPLLGGGGGRAGRPSAPGGALPPREVRAVSAARGPAAARRTVRGRGPADAGLRRRGRGGGGQLSRGAGRRRRRSGGATPWCASGAAPPPGWTGALRRNAKSLAG